MKSYSPYLVVMTILACLTFSLMISFVLLNWFLQCDSWDQPECVTPSEFFQLVIGQ